VQQALAPSVQLNVTSGAIRAVYLKHDSCVDPTVDIVDGSCSGPCDVSWFTLYDEFYGLMQHSYSGVLSLPFGPTPWIYDPDTTKRRAGDWYISVQALPNMAGEFSLQPSLLTPPREPESYSCSRFDGFCPRAFYSAGPQGAAQTSGACRSRAAPLAGVAARAVWPLASCLALLAAWGGRT